MGSKPFMMIEEGGEDRPALPQTRPVFRRPALPDIVFWGVACTLLFVGLGSTSLWGSEDRWAEVVREMLLTGRWFHPAINGEPYFDKPLFTYWVILLAKALTGSLDEWTIRIPSAIAGLITLWATRHLGRTLWSEQAGRLAGWLLLSSYGFAFLSRTAMAEMENVAGILLALVWYWSRRERPGFATYLVFYGIVFAGAQMKGLVAVAVPLVAVMPDLVRGGRWRRHVRLDHVLAAGLGALIYMAPFVYSSITAGGYQSNGLAVAFRESIQRYFQPFDHQEPMYLYVEYVPVLFLPWFPLLFLAIARVIRRRRSLDVPTWWLCMATGIVFLFFTASGSRRSYYVLPILPLCALLTGLFLAADTGERGRRAVRMLLAGACITACAAEVVVAIGWSFLRQHLPIQLPVDLPASLLWSGVVVGGVGLLPWLFRRASADLLGRLTGIGAEAAPLVVTATVLLGGFFCWQRGSLEEFRPLRPFALEVAAEGCASKELAFYQQPDGAIIFYLNAEGSNPVLTTPEEVQAFFGRSRGLLILRRRDLDALIPQLPAGTRGEIVHQENVLPWQQYRANKSPYVAWRLKTR